MQYPKRLEKIFSLLQKLPGVGRRTAQRYAFDLLLHWSERSRHELKLALDELQDVKLCETCGCLVDEHACLYCSNPMRRNDQLCIVSSPKEVYTIEGTREFTGLYHVLPTLLSPLDGRGEEKLQFAKIGSRISSGAIREIILALDSSLEGDATCLFLKDRLASFPVSVSRLAFGIPVGSSIEYVDGGTLARALASRASF